MNRPALRLVTLSLAFASVAACSPSPPSAAKPSEVGQFAAVQPPAPAAAPAKPMKMVCRNSQSGQKVACGTANAVMVGMEPE